VKTKRKPTTMIKIKKVIEGSQTFFKQETKITTMKDSTSSNLKIEGGALPTHSHFS